MQKIFILIAALLLTTNAYADENSLVKSIKKIETDFDAKIGVAVYDLNTDDLWSYNADETYPLMSTFKTLACANVLKQVDEGKLSLDTEVKIDSSDIITEWSPVLKDKANQSLTIKQLCDAMMMQSDNSAANVILKTLGGPESITQFAKSLGQSKTNLTRNEPNLNNVTSLDKIDSTTPNEMVKMLDSLLYTNILSEDSKLQLLEWMKQNQVADILLRSITPEDVNIADRSGANEGGRAITAVVWNDKMKPIIIAIYIAHSNLEQKYLHEAIVDIGEKIYRQFKVI